MMQAARGAKVAWIRASPDDNAFTCGWPKLLRKYYARIFPYPRIERLSLAARRVL